MCKEMSVIPVDTVVDKKRIIGKNGGGEKAQGVTDPQKYLTALPFLRSVK
jgi:hypothetical protein